MLAIDADSHFVEPLDLFERRIDSRFRDRAPDDQRVFDVRGIPLDRLLLF
jgi:hypothetical protein